MLQFQQLMESPYRSSRFLTVFLSAICLSYAAAQDGGTSTVSMVQVVILLILFILSGFMSGSETALTAIGEWKIRQLREEGKDPSGVFALLEQDRTRFITTLLIGNNLVNIAATALVTQMAINLSRDLGFAESLAVGYATGVMTILILIFGEITPKSIAVHNAVPFARLIIRPVHILSRVLYPVGLAFTFITSNMLRLFRLESSNNPLITENELRLMLRSAEESGVIEAHEEEMIKGVIDLEETVVREVMTPRVDMIAIAEDDTLQDLLERNKDHQFSRLPVYQETVDNIRGIVYMRDLLSYFQRPEALATTPVAELMTAAQYVPETLSILQLLRDMRSRKNHMAIVVDEFGGTAGLITLEDIIEEITGEIYDETDLEEEDDIVALSETEYRIQAFVHLDDLEARFKLSFADDGEFDTLAGFLMNHFGYIPQAGESMEFQGVRFTIETADERRVSTVMLTILSDVESTGDESGTEAETDAASPNSA